MQGETVNPVLPVPEKEIEKTVTRTTVIKMVAAPPTAAPCYRHQQAAGPLHLVDELPSALPPSTGRRVASVFNDSVGGVSDKSCPLPPLA